MDEAFLANHELSSKSKKLDETFNSIVELQAEQRKQSVDFFNRIALLSGGIISLSITFLGYLASSQNGRVVFTELLFLSWTLLLVAVFASLYRNHFNNIMGHWQTLIQLNDARIEMYKAELTLMKVSPQSFANINTPQELAEQISKTEKGIKNLTKGGEDIKKSETKYSRLWIISQNASHIGFAVGVVVTVIFAGLNVPVRTEYTIIDAIMRIGH